MVETPVHLPAALAPTRIEEVIETVLVDTGLQITLKTTLKQYPGCLHWHIKHGRAAGTLEITYWPAERRAWLSVHHNRSAPWIPGAVAVLVSRIELLLQAESGAAL